MPLKVTPAAVEFGTSSIDFRKYHLVEYGRPTPPRGVHMEADSPCVRLVLDLMQSDAIVDVRDGASVQIAAFTCTGIDALAIREDGVLCENARRHGALRR